MMEGKMNEQSKGLKYGYITRVEPVAKPPRKRNPRKQSRPTESEVVGQAGEDTGETLPEGGEGDAVGETDSDI